MRNLNAYKMVFRFFIILCVFTPCNVVAQIEMKNISLIDSNLAALHIYNTIKISGLKDYSNLELKSKRGKVSKTYDSDGSVFEVIEKYCSEGLDTLTLYQNNELLLSKEFHVKFEPEAKRQFGKITSNLATLDEILDDTKMHFSLCSSQKLDSAIKHFELTIFEAQSKSIIRFKANKNNALTAKQIKEIKKLNAGSKLFFENIRVIIDGLQRTLSSIIITIK